MKSLYLLFLLVLNLTIATAQEPEVVRINTELVQTAVTVLDETSNYYLVAWRPEKDEEKAPKFRHVKIGVVDQPELTVRAPRGYFDGPATNTAAASTESKPKTPDTEIRDALRDGFPSHGLPVLLSLTYLNTPANGLVVTSSMEIAGTGLTFGDDGKQPATIRLAGVVLNDKGRVAGSFRNQLNINPRKASEPDGGVFYGRYDLKVTITDSVAGTTATQLADFIVR